jgi:L-alanine-DL-glutamate epimerase-like enolase superfamily enzyme
LAVNTSSTTPIQVRVENVSQLFDTLVNQFRRLLVGQDPLNVDALWERIRVSGIFAGAQGGQYVTALTGIEIALWDLAGKALGLPVYQLLGGKFRDKVRIYCDSDMEDPLGPESDKKLPWIRDQGFQEPCNGLASDDDAAVDGRRAQP